MFQGEDNSRVYVSDVKVFKDHLYATDWEGVISEWKVNGPDLKHVRTIVPPLVPGNILKVSNACFSFGYLYHIARFEKCRKIEVFS